MVNESLMFEHLNKITESIKALGIAGKNNNTNATILINLELIMIQQTEIEMRLIALEKQVNKINEPRA